MPRPASAVAPSGQQFAIGHGQDSIVVTEIGATLRSYTVDGRPVVDGFEADERCSSGRGQVLAPWPNRLGDGRYRFGERAARAAWDEPEHQNAIHGLVRWLPWQARARAQNVLTMGVVLHPQPGYPWRIDLELEYRLGRGGLSIRATATNLDDEPAPFGIGFHPYVTVGTPVIDTARLHLPARQMLRSDERGLPTGVESVTGTEYDFSTTRPIGPTRLDTAFTALERDAEGIARVVLRHPDEDRTVTVWMDRAFTTVMAYTGDTMAQGERRRRSIAVEPMSCPPDALRSGTDLVTLAPGAAWHGHWGISPA
jgi:galactose mutarotase-like enzyme